MKSYIAIAAAIAVPALAQAPGSAIVINSCSYPVYLQNTPAAGGGYNEIDQTLQPGGTYEQIYTPLSNQDGWSLKLSPTEGDFGNGILQYEYTYQTTGDWNDIIWFDLSEVNGSPFGGDWFISATGNCAVKQTAYLYSTDDAQGEQSCPLGSSVTVNICSGSASSGGSGGAAVSPSVASTTTPIATPSPTTLATQIVPAAASVSAPSAVGFTAAPPATTNAPFSPSFNPANNENNNVPSSTKSSSEHSSKHSTKHHGKPSTSKKVETKTETVKTTNHAGATVTHLVVDHVTKFVTVSPTHTEAAHANKRHHHVHARPQHVHH